MVAAFYGIKTDPQQLNTFLTRTGDFTSDGLIHWSRAHIDRARTPVTGLQWRSFLRIDRLEFTGGKSRYCADPTAGWRLSFRGDLGKEGWDYLIRDLPASPFRRVYHMRNLTDRIAGLCFFRTV
jgi:hypothetical protein